MTSPFLERRLKRTPVQDAMHAAADREWALQAELDAWKKENVRLRDIITGVRDDNKRLRSKCNRLIDGVRYFYDHINERDGEIKAFAWALWEDAGIHPGDLDPEPHAAASETEAE